MVYTVEVMTPDSVRTRAAKRFPRGSNKVPVEATHMPLFKVQGNLDAILGATATVMQRSRQFTIHLRELHIGSEIYATPNPNFELNQFQSRIADALCLLNDANDDEEHWRKILGPLNQNQLESLQHYGHPNFGPNSWKPKVLLGHGPQKSNAVYTGSVPYRVEHILLTHGSRQTEVIERYTLTE